MVKSLEKTVSTVVVAFPGGDYSWDEVIGKVVDYLGRTESVACIDVSANDFVKESYAPWPLERLLGVERPNLTAIKIPRAHFKGGLSLSSDEVALYEAALKSAIFSILRTDRPSGIQARFLGEALKKSFNATLSSMILFLSANPNVNKIVIPNGRFPQQIAVVIAAKRFGLDAYYYERGTVPETIFLQQFQTTSINSRGSYLRNLTSVSEADIAAAGRSLNSQLEGTGSVVTYGKRWAKTDLTSLSGCITFFTSSQDEFWALGPEWSGVHEDQYDAALDFLASKKPHPVDNVVIRMHPNTLNKSLPYVIRELAKVARFRRAAPLPVIVVGPLSSVNSYDLARLSSLVMTWNSTIGLESLAMGKEVVCFAPSRWLKYLDQKAFSVETHWRGRCSEHAIHSYMAREDKLNFRVGGPWAGLNAASWRVRLLHLFLGRPPILVLRLLSEVTNRWVVAMVFMVMERYWSRKYQQPNPNRSSKG